MRLRRRGRGYASSDRKVTDLRNPPEVPPLAVQHPEHEVRLTYGPREPRLGLDGPIASAFLESNPDIPRGVCLTCEGLMMDLGWDDVTMWRHVEPGAYDCGDPPIVQVEHEGSKPVRPAVVRPWWERKGTPLHWHAGARWACAYNAPGDSWWQTPAHEGWPVRRCGESDHPLVGAVPTTSSGVYGGDMTSINVTHTAPDGTVTETEHANAESFYVDDRGNLNIYDTKAGQSTVGAYAPGRWHNAAVVNGMVAKHLVTSLAGHIERAKREGGSLDLHLLVDEDGVAALTSR